MKYFSPSYWFKLWLLSVPLFNDETIGINAKSIDNKKIKDWASNNTNLQSINQDMNFTNSTTNYQPYNLIQQSTNQNIDPIYQTNLDSISSQELEKSTHKHRHEKSRNRHKRANKYEYGSEISDSSRKIKFYGYNDWYKGEIHFNLWSKKIEFKGNSDYFHRYFGNGGNTKYLGITIYDQNYKLIKDISINAWDWMTKIINDYNLQNGIDYQEGYIIKIYSKEPWRTWFNIGNNNYWNRFAFTDSADWDWTWKYRINNNIIIDYYEYTKMINFLGLSNDYKGEIGLDTTNQKIMFFGNDEKFHVYFDGKNGLNKIYNQVLIYNEYNNLNKKIYINGEESMNYNINYYNLQNGIPYKEGYIIEIWSAEPWRTQFLKNNHFQYITKDRTRDSSFKNLNQMFIINNNKIIEYKENLNNLDITKNLNVISNNDDKTILNFFNYLNQDLNISQLKVINKNSFEATIMPIYNSYKYIHSTKVYYLIQNKNIIDINELIKQAIFFTFRDRNYNSFKGEIKSLNLENVLYSNIKLIKNNDIENNNFVENICSGSIEFPSSPYEQTYQSPSCEYSEEQTRKYEIKIGLIKTVKNTNSNEESSTITTNDIKTETKNWNSNIESGFSIFGFSLGGSISRGGETSNTNENSTSHTSSFLTTVTLENTFDLSNTNTHEIKISKKIIFPSQPVKVLAYQKAKISFIINKTISKLFLTLKQDIYGEIQTVISSKNINNITLNISIKELMQTLQRNSLLPPEITINNNNSITFDEKILVTQMNNLDSNLNIDRTNTSQIVKRDVYKWTDNFSKSINNEQHLPIDNKTNFVASNITSL